MSIHDFVEYIFKGEYDDLIIHYWVSSSSGHDMEISCTYDQLKNQDPKKLESNIFELYSTYEVQEYPKVDHTVIVHIRTNVWIF